ncbi:hypothetical protein MHYP_G00231120 [Metynnis hypsauchen]
MTRSHACVLWSARESKRPAAERVMEDDFGQSLTPPVSPFMPEDVCEPAARPPCFTCAYEPGREDAHMLPSDGYVSRGALKRLLLKLDPSPADFEVDTVDIFGFPWVTETALVESTKLLFGLLRQKVFRLETLVQSSSHDFGQASGLHYEAEELRQQCVLFLTYIKVFIHRFLEVPRHVDEGFVHPYSELEAQLPSTLVEELFGITLLIGRLKDLPTNVQSALTIQHQGRLFPPSWHLLHLHLDIHWCVLEILHLLGQRMMGQVVYAHQFVDLTGETLTNVSLFEDHLNNLLCDLITVAMNKYSKVRPTETLTSNHYYCACTKELWVLLIHLLEYRSKTQHTQSFWGYVNALLQAVLKGAPPGDRDPGLPANCKDPLGFTWWLITHLAQLGMYNRNGTLQSEKQLEDNWSFVLELLKSSCDMKAAVPEEQMRMLVHCCLSLSLMWGSNVSAVNTLWEYYSKNLNGSFSVPWLGVSGLASISPTPLTLLEQAKSCCSPEPMTSASHTQLYRSANSFLIFLRMLALHLSQESAPGAPWRQIKGRRVQQRFNQLGSSDFPSWAPPPSVVKERHLAVAVALWTHFFPFLRSLRLSQTPPPQLADAAAGFTLLALDTPSSAPQDLQPHPLQAIMQCFGWDEMLCPLLVTRYLNHLLQNGELVGWMGSGSASSSAQALCVRAWFRCVLQQHLHKSPDNSRAGKVLDEQLAELTRLVLRLPEIDSLLQRASLQPTASKLEPKPALALFIKSVGRVYATLQLLAERSSLVCKALEYVGDVLKFIKPYLLNRSSDGLQLTYWTLGCVVKHWSPLLATTKAQSLLLRIVDVLLLPHSLLQQDKAPPTQVLSALRDTLPLYLQGLSVAASVSQTQGVYLRQQLRNVIAQYMSRFLPATPTTGAVANHPVLLAGCEATPTPRGAVLRRTILQVLRDNFLQFKGHAPPPRLAAVLSFLLELLRRNNDTDPDLLTITLPPALRCLMLVNEPQVKRLSADCVQLIVERCLSAARDQPCEQIITVLRTFVEENEAVYDLQVYSVLETVAILSPSTVSSLIPVLSLSLRNTEQKRGLGRNISLRNAYKSLLGLLGEAGQAELVSLEED